VLDSAEFRPLPVQAATAQAPAQAPSTQSAPGAVTPTAVAIRLPPLPAYHSAKMDLRAEIDRGEVVLARPKLDKDGHKKWHPPVSDCPTLTLYARVVHGAEVQGVGYRRRHLARDSGHADLAPGDGHTDAQAAHQAGDTWEPKTEIIGPGYRAAYGLVALVHHQIEGRFSGGS